VANHPHDVNPSLLMDCFDNDCFDCCTVSRDPDRRSVLQLLRRSTIFSKQVAGQVGPRTLIPNGGSSMIRLLSVFAALLALVAFVTPATAADAEVSLDGKILCGKCELKESAKCAVAMVVEKDGKKSTYWFDADSSKKYHGDVCQEVKPGKVTGTVKKEGDKMILTVKTLVYAK